MLRFVITLHTYAQDAAAQMVARWLKERFSNTEGICYYRHPAVITSAGAFPDFISFTKENHPLVIKIVSCELQEIDLAGDDFWIINNESIDSPLLELEDLVIKLESKFLDQRKLRNRLRPQGVLALPFITRRDFENRFGPLQGEMCTIWAGGDTEALQHPLEQILSDEEWTLTRAVIQGATTLHKPTSPIPTNVATMGVAIKELDKQVASLDDEQELVALQIAPGPQRIRGLAGTGKTVLLAMKAANIHLQDPNKKILFTFNTQSLYNQVRELISKSYRAHSGNDPNWEYLHIRHAWGGRSRRGVYSDLCARQGVFPLDFQAARTINREDPFQACCKQALKSSIVPEYDFILIDEAQDFPNEFFQLLFKLSVPPEHKIYWAYDELQSLSSLAIPKPEDLFGVDKSGNPLISLTGEDYPGPIEKDFVLHSSYRCPRNVLMLAHAIGLGIQNPHGGCVQMLEDKGAWEAIGYKIESGQLRNGERVVISRPEENSPNRIRDIYNKQELITADEFQDRLAELGWVAESIRKNIQEEGIAPKQIIVISLDTSKAKSYFVEIQRRLVEYGIASTIPGLIDDTSAFAETGRVTLSTVYRAKGNEAYIVYIISFDSLYDYLEGIGNRNRAFASITRSKAWVRITGTGKKMVEAKKEVDKILADIPKFRFVFPDMNKIRRLDAENSRKRKEVVTADKSASVLIKADKGALGALNPDMLKTLKERISEVLSENQ
ncbi:MAG: DEAD/DEAH box helicase [Ktedonobacteraceae bacterium]